MWFLSKLTDQPSQYMLHTTGQSHSILQSTRPTTLITHSKSHNINHTQQIFGNLRSGEYSISYYTLNTSHHTFPETFTSEEYNTVIILQITKHTSDIMNSILNITYPWVLLRCSQNITGVTQRC